MIDLTALISRTLSGGGLRNGHTLKGIRRSLSVLTANSTMQSCGPGSCERDFSRPSVSPWPRNLQLVNNDWGRHNTTQIGNVEFWRGLRKTDIFFQIIHTYTHTPVQKISSSVIWKRDIYWRRYKIQETSYIGQWCFSPLQSRHLGTSHSSSSHHHCTIIFFWISSTIWHLLPFKGDFNFGKSQKSQGIKSGL